MGNRQGEKETEEIGTEQEGKEVFGKNRCNGSRKHQGEIWNYRELEGKE